MTNSPIDNSHSGFFSESVSIEFAEICCGENEEARAALKLLNSSSSHLCVVVSRQGRLLGTISDGDIRRGLLAGLTLDQEAGDYMRKDPIKIVDGQSDASSVLKDARVREITVIPVVDEDDVLIEVLNLRIKRKPLNNLFCIMAGGKGERLRPLTLNVPKPLIPVGGTPIIEHLIRRAHKGGFCRFAVSLNYMKEKMITSLSPLGIELGIQLEFVEEKTPLGTAGALAELGARELDSLVVANGDVLTDTNLAHLLSELETRGLDGLIVGRHFDLTNPYGVLHHQDGHLLGLAEKPVYSSLVNAGIYCLKPKILQLLDANKRMDMTELIELSLARGLKIGVFELNGFWMDIGNVRDLEWAEQIYSQINVRGV